MNRIDRLTAMILMLQGRRVVTAQQIAEHFEISVRTVYRDMAARGEAGGRILRGDLISRVIRRAHVFR